MMLLLKEEKQSIYKLLIIFSDMAKRGQIAAEYMMLLGIVLFITVPLLFYAIRESNNNIKISQADDSVNTLARAADTVYSIGPGTKKYVWVNMPKGVESYSVDNKSVLIKLQIFGGLSDVHSNTKADLVGVIPISKGQHKVIVEMLESGYVQFGDADDTIAPVVIWTDPSGTINYQGIVIRATTNEYALCRYDESDVSYSSMSEPFVGSALTHERDLGILPIGNYTYFVRCQDPSENTMEESAIINFTIVPPLSGNESNGSGTGESYEPDAPIISLVSPADGYKDGDGTILFEYNVSDDSSILFCHLIINRTIDQTDFSVFKNITQNFTKTGIDYGNYTWGVNCSDVHGNINSSEIRNFSINISQDHDLPVVHLISPADYTIRNYWLTSFNYNVSDATSGIAYCELNMVGQTPEDTSLSWVIRDSPVQEATTESITLPLFRANYTWNISCVDNSYLANKGYSETWHLQINISPGEEAFIDSCGGWCGWQGFGNGLCSQSPNKCANNCGLPYSPSCYAGNDVSAQYCVAGSQAPSCCCAI